MARLVINLLLDHLKALRLVKGETGHVFLVNREGQLVTKLFRVIEQLLAQAITLMVGINKQRSQLIAQQRTKPQNPGLILNDTGL
ncbi:hypothetical protein D3C77_565340 [compost metagenome]